MDACFPSSPGNSLVAFRGLPPDRQLDDGQIDLWCVPLDSPADPQLLDACRGLLSDEERREEGRFRADEPKAQFLVSRALVRLALSHYTAAPRDCWQFRRSNHGKPFVTAAAAEHLQFNVSHTRGLVVCGLTRERELGVDVERLSRRTNVLGLAGRFFAPVESAAVHAALPNAQRELFLRFWTLKEAFVKAHGRGLTLPLSSFAFTLADDAAPRIAFEPSLGEDADQWRFAEFPLGSQFQIGVALRRPARWPLALRRFEMAPFDWP